MRDQELVLRSDDLSVTVLPGIGARLHRLEAFGTNVLRTPPTTHRHREDPFYWGAYHMAPWCNRLDAATPIPVGADIIELKPNFSDGTAMHGQMFAAPWTHTDDGVFVVRGGGRNGWPWTYELTLRMVLVAASVQLQYSLTNTSDAPMPAGLGLHPWFRQPALVRIPATHGFPVNARTASQPEPMTGTLDLRTAAPLPDGLDACWTDLTTPKIEVRWPQYQIAMSMLTDATDPVIVAAHPADLDTVAVEPQTHAPAGLRRLLRGEPYGMSMLGPGHTLTFAITLTFNRTARGTA